MGIGLVKGPNDKAWDFRKDDTEVEENQRVNHRTARGRNSLVSGFEVVR